MLVSKRSTRKQFQVKLFKIPQNDDRVRDDNMRDVQALDVDEIYWFYVQTFIFAKFSSVAHGDE